MSSVGAQQILLGTAIAAVSSTSHLRVYIKDTAESIRESSYENGWAGGQPSNVIAQATIGSPIAATSKELNHIRVYYVSQDNTLKEAAYDAGTGWYDGQLSMVGVTVAPYSKLAAVFLAGTDQLLLRVYAQLNDNTIQEFGWNSDEKGWSKGVNLSQALPGSGIASTSFQKSQLSIRTYIQEISSNIVEKAYDAYTGWSSGTFTSQSAPPRTAIALTSFGDSICIRVYYTTTDNHVVERVHYTGTAWYDGDFDQASTPGMQIAVISSGRGPNGLNLRVYLQQGALVTAISETVWSNGAWSPGEKALPPA
ncbi:fucose-specific lectin [Talaromyces proteolyticus]|uniref:Fucose-specific lectin n=1 Tax=Talaromyces proteolyticus TaxID=1131652 RepID=A0AAD4KVE3_9EURO|nr:fucose-specific lectin [Talaromyces proteolyticus]KAH8700675.1 fucose-specific lectin [Talaromyces proteolyticus]